MLALVFVLMIGVGAWLLRRRSLLGWAGLGVLAAAGFWTVPVMLFPYVRAVMAWLALEGLSSPAVKRIYQRSFVLYMIGAPACSPRR